MDGHRDSMKESANGRFFENPINQLMNKNREEGLGPFLGTAGALFLSDPQQVFTGTHYMHREVFRLLNYTSLHGTAIIRAGA